LHSDRRGYELSRMKLYHHPFSGFKSH
jgi:hypothetical protein